MYGEQIQATATSPASSDPISAFPSPDKDQALQEHKEVKDSGDPIVDFSVIHSAAGKVITPPEHSVARLEAERSVEEVASSHRSDAVLEKTKESTHCRSASMPATARQAREPPIHAALKKSLSLSANDRTQICIDITGENDEVEHDQLNQFSSDEVTDDQSQMRDRFVSLTPFIDASGKWFSTFDTNLQHRLATRARQLAIESHHFPSMHAALYILSRGPWVPTHISVHVRQAALAAVGIGWSWINQIPTPFPFSQFDASLSLATLEDVPTNQVTQAEAIFRIYSALSENLTPHTRNYLFSKCEVQCHHCDQVTKIPAALFNVTITVDNTFEDILQRMVPVWNNNDMKNWQTCQCLSLIQAKHRCTKFGPLVFIRLTGSHASNFPRLETTLVQVGNQATVQGRSYEVHCLVTTNRIGQDEPLILIHASQPGMCAVYDHNNGLRTVETGRINSKLHILGVLVLPIKSPKAILTTKDLVAMAGAVATASYTKRQLKVVKAILKPSQQKNLQTNGQSDQKKTAKRRKRSKQSSLNGKKPDLNKKLSRKKRGH